MMAKAPNSLAFIPILLGFAALPAGASVERERAYLAIDPTHVGIHRGAIRDPDVSPDPLLAQGITIPAE